MGRRSPLMPSALISLLLAGVAAVRAQTPAIVQDLPVQRLAVARELTSADEAELARVIAQHGKPWLMLGPLQGQFSEHWSMVVYLQPSEDSGAIRRGKVLFVTTQANAGAKDLQNWRVSPGNYAQVPLNRTATLSADSAEMPFVEADRLPDADLLSLVAMVRACPCRPQGDAAARAPVGGEVDGKRPIGRVRLGSGSAVHVGVQRDRSSSWVLEFRRDGTAWRLVSIGFVIA